MSEEQQKIRFDGVQMAAGALTAVTSAVLLSTVGVAGTLIGAAVGSVLGTVGNAVYSHYLALSKRRVAAAKVLAESRTRGASTRHGGTGSRSAAEPDTRVEEAREELAQAEVDPESARRGKVAWREIVSTLPWKRILPITGAVFVVVLGAILAFELLAGRAISSYTGGSDETTRTSIPGVGRTQDRDQDRDQQPDRERRDQQPDSPDQGEGDQPAPEGTPTTEPAPTETTVPEPTVEPTPQEEPEVPQPEEPTTVP